MKPRTTRLLTAALGLAAALAVAGCDLQENADLDNGRDMFTAQCGTCHALAEAGTVAVLIPGAATFLDEPQRPPVEAMRAAGVRIAVASDLNPGSAPLGSMQLAMALAATRFGLTPVEVVHGATRHAAAALGLADRGELAIGMRADIALWDAGSAAALAYWFGVPLLSQLWISGEKVLGAGNDGD